MTIQMSVEISAGNRIMCLAAVDGWRTQGSFDLLPRGVRDLLNNSRFNICPVCFMGLRRERGASELRYEPYIDPQLLADFEYAIDHGLDRVPDGRRLPAPPSRHW